METLEKRKTHRRSFPQKATPPRFKSVDSFRDWHPALPDFAMTVEEMFRLP